MPKILFTYMDTIEFFVEEGKPLGGSAVETLVWMKIFKELGFDVQQVRYKNEPRNRISHYKWIEFIPLFNSEFTMIRLWYLYRLPLYFKALKRSKCNYLFTSIPAWYSFYLSVFCKILGIKYILRIPSDIMVDDRLYLKESKINSQYIKWAYKLSYAILAQNEYQYLKLISKFPKKKILKIYNPFVLDQKFLVKKKKPEGFIAWVANFRQVKNLALLYRIAKMYPNEIFKIAGKPINPLDIETEESLSNLRNLPNVNFVGQVAREDILDFFSGAKYLLNTSRFEGFSNTFIEAMATGTPILSTENVNPDNIISDYQIGGLYNSEIDLKIFFSSSIEKEYIVWSTNCLKFVKENHDYKRIGKKLGKVL